MKKILALLLVFVLASGLAACGSAPAAPAPSSSAPAPSKDAPSAPATPADSGLNKVGIVNNPPSNPDTALQMLQTLKKSSMKLTDTRLQHSTALRMTSN